MEKSKEKASIQKDDKKPADEKAKPVEKIGQSESQACAVCNITANKSCSACHLVWYCSLEHQKSDWTTHKKNCCPTILKNNDKFGRHLVAARKLKAGSLVIEESPIFCSPRGLVEEFDTPICLSCCSLMDNESTAYRCSKCLWPLCCWTCEQNKFHAENECKIFAENKIPYPPPGSYAVYVTYKVIEILRGVLIKERDPENWKKLMDLQYSTDMGRKTALFEDLPKLRKTFGVENLGTEDDWHRVLGILNVNNFSMEGQRGTESPSFTGFLFLKSSMLTHSCAPNCWWGATVFPKYKMQVRATVEIQKGEVLTIPYSYLYNSFGTTKRQELIQDDGEFVCKCIRCLDPTELKSYSSALTCLDCKSGNVLPVNPIEIESDWKCDACNQNYNSSAIDLRLEDLISKLEECGALPEMEKFISENQEINIHKNHWLITEAENVILKERARNPWDRIELPIEERDKLISLCEHLLSVKNLVAPGFSLERAGILNHLARAKLEKLEYQVRNKFLSDQETISSEVEAIYSLYDEALQFYKNDQTETPVTESLCLKAKTIMSDMSFVRNRFNDANIVKST